MHLSPGIPVLWRGDGSSQIGLRHPLRVDSRDTAAVRLLEYQPPRAARRRGTASPTDVVSAEFPPVTVSKPVAARLAATGWTDAAVAVRPDLTLRVRGLSPVGLASLTAFVEAGVAHLAVVDHPCDRPRANAIAQSPPMEGRVHADAERGVDGELVIALGSVSAVMRHRLRAASVPHVAVLTDEAGASVIPVLPSRTACLDCRELHLTDHDPAWPVLARQCEARLPWTDSLTAQVAGLIAAASLLALATGREVPGAVRIEGGVVTPEPLTAHPACGCVV